LMCVFPTSQIIGFDRVLGRVCPILHKLKFI
jgi:thiosulfate dehydrogenase [quinone] large subunit